MRNVQKVDVDGGVPLQGWVSTPPELMSKVPLPTLHPLLQAFSSCGVPALQIIKSGPLGLQAVL